jgi:predicted RNA-binding protein
VYGNSLVPYIKFLRRTFDEVPLMSDEMLDTRPKPKPRPVIPAPVPAKPTIDKITAKPSKESKESKAKTSTKKGKAVAPKVQVG